jgi:hypothetical protein
MTTVEHLVPVEHRPGLWSSVMFCAAETCDVAYFMPGGLVVPKVAVAVPVFQKESSAARPVCYCFKHSVADVLAGARPDGSNVIVDAIMEACRNHLDRCEETNPQGRCCLGNVRSLLQTKKDGGTACPSCATDNRKECR